MRYASFLVCLMERNALPCLASSYCGLYGWPKANLFHTCLWLLTALAIVGLHKVIEGCYTNVTCEMDIPIYCKIIKCWNLPKPQTKQGGARPSKRWQNEAAPRQDSISWFWKKLYYGLPCGHFKGSHIYLYDRRIYRRRINIPFIYSALGPLTWGSNNILQWRNNYSKLQTQRKFWKSFQLLS